MIRPDVQRACPVTGLVWASGSKVLFGKLAKLIGNGSG
jgi:hypothetical protein